MTTFEALYWAEVRPRKVAVAAIRMVLESIFAVVGWIVGCWLLVSWVGLVEVLFDRKLVLMVLLMVVEWSMRGPGKESE